MGTFREFGWVCASFFTSHFSLLNDLLGHTACLWEGDKLLVYGGENEHREYLSDVVIFNLRTAHWTQPDVRGQIPKGRARHAAVVHNDKLFIVGGLTGTDTYTLDDVCYLDLKTWTWSRTWSFVGRFDHSAWVWGGRLWVFGGLGPDMERGGELWWLELRGNPAFTSAPAYGTPDISNVGERFGQSPRAAFNQPQHVTTGSSGYTANSSSVQIRASSNIPKPVAPGSISTVKFVSGPNVPSQTVGTHFHVYSSCTLLDFVTPAGTIRPSECNLASLELDTLRWQKLAEGPEIFDPAYRWHYCAVNEDGTKAWLLGCATDPPENGAGNNFENYLSDVLPIDLKRFGLLGNHVVPETGLGRRKLPASDRNSSSPLGALGADLASMFDQIPETGSGADFVITGERDDDDDERSTATSHTIPQDQDFPTPTSSTSTQIHVHKLILQARWPHFSRLYASQMAEFHTKRMHIPEPYSVVRAFLYYLYTDSISHHAEYCADLADVAGMLVMASVYDMPRLRLLCLHRLSRELDVQHAAIVWERAATANEDWLKRRAAIYCMTHWGRVVRTEGFRRLSRQSLMELCEVVDMEGRVVGGDDLEVFGGLGGGKIGVGGLGREAFKARGSVGVGQVGEEMDDGEGEDDEGMDVN